MLVKCRICGNKIDKVKAFKVLNGTINMYYCSEEEYKDSLKANISKDNVFKSIEKIFGYKCTHTSIFKELSEISKIYSNEKIGIYLEENEEYLRKIMLKEFSGEYGKIRYFSTILRNNLQNYKHKTVDVKKTVQIDIPKDNYTQRIQRKSFVELESEVGE